MLSFESMKPRDMTTVSDWPLGIKNKEFCFFLNQRKFWKYMYRFIIFDLQSTYIFSVQPESIEQTIGRSRELTGK